MSKHMNFDPAVFNNSICYSVELGAPGARRQVKSEQIGNDEDASIRTDADPNSITISKHLFDSDQYKAIIGIDAAIRSYIRKIALASPLRSGIYLIPLTLIDQVRQRVDSLLEDRKKAIQTFLEYYPQLKEDRKKKLASLYKESEFPNVATLQGAFRDETKIFEFNVPGKLKSVSVQLFEQEQEKQREMWTKLHQEVEETLFDGFKLLLDRAVNTLGLSATGKKKKFHGVEGLIEFLELFDKRNIINQEQLASLVKEARKVIGGQTNNEIKELARDSDRYRASIHTQFEKISKKLETLIVDRGRRIDL